MRDRAAHSRPGRNTGRARAAWAVTSGEAPEDPAGDSAVDGGTADGGVMDDGMVDPGMGVTMEESVPEDTGDSTDAAEDAASDSLEGSPMEGLAR